MFWLLSLLNAVLISNASKIHDLEALSHLLILEELIAHFIVLLVEGVRFSWHLVRLVLGFPQSVLAAGYPFHLVNVVPATIIFRKKIIIMGIIDLTAVSGCLSCRHKATLL
jgi:hypothetical protein